MTSGHRASEVSQSGGALPPKLSGLVFADIDTKPGKVGETTYDGTNSCTVGRDTFTTGSPSGGRHRWYRGPHLYALGGPTTEHQDIDFPQYVVLPGCMKSDGTGYTSARIARSPTRRNGSGGTRIGPR